MRLTFWGTRGSLPAPGRDYVRYGGNTTCLEIRSGGRLVVVDAGTGIRALGKTLTPGPLELDLLLTHLHWDHIFGFNFFAPLYQKGSRIRLGGCPRAREGLQGLFDCGSVADGRFPVAWLDLPAILENLPAFDGPLLQLGPLTVSATPMNHPQGCLGFRFQDQGGAVAFFTDNELVPGDAGLMDRLAAFCKGAKVLIHDAQYLPGQREVKRGWGHSDWRAALDLALAAGVERLILTHHDPDRTDDQIDRLVEEARQAAPRGISVEGAREGMVLET